jgi:hypothetical protein
MKKEKSISWIKKILLCFTENVYTYIYYCFSDITNRLNYCVIVYSIYMICGQGSSVGIVTDYGLNGPRIEPRGGGRFSAHVQTSPGAHPPSCTMGLGGQL